MVKYWVILGGEFFFFPFVMPFSNFHCIYRFFCVRSGEGEGWLLASAIRIELRMMLSDWSIVVEENVCRVNIRESLYNADCRLAVLKGVDELLSVSGTSPLAICLSVRSRT